MQQRWADASAQFRGFLWNKYLPALNTGLRNHWLATLEKPVIGAARAVRQFPLSANESTNWLWVAGICTFISAWQFGNWPRHSCSKSHKTTSLSATTTTTATTTATTTTTASSAIHPAAVGVDLEGPRGQCEAWFREGVQVAATDPARSIALFSRCLSVHPRHAGALVNRARMYLVQGEFNRCLGDVETVMARAPWTQNQNGSSSSNNNHHNDNHLDNNPTLEHDQNDHDLPSHDRVSMAMASQASLFAAVAAHCLGLRASALSHIDTSLQLVVRLAGLSPARFQSQLAQPEGSGGAGEQDHVIMLTAPMAILQNRKLLTMYLSRFKWRRVILRSEKVAVLKPDHPLEGWEAGGSSKEGGSDGLLHITSPRVLRPGAGEGKHSPLQMWQGGSQTPPPLSPSGEASFEPVSDSPVLGSRSLARHVAPTAGGVAVYGMPLQRSTDLPSPPASVQNHGGGGGGGGGPDHVGGVGGQRPATHSSRRRRWQRPNGQSGSPLERFRRSQLQWEQSRSPSLAGDTPAHPTPPSSGHYLSPAGQNDYPAHGGLYNSPPPPVVGDDVVIVGQTPVYR